MGNCLAPESKGDVQTLRSTAPGDVDSPKERGQRKEKGGLHVYVDGKEQNVQVYKSKSGRYLLKDDIIQLKDEDYTMVSDEEAKDVVKPLMDMGIQAFASSSAPFIGLLVIEPLSLYDLQVGIKKPGVWFFCEGEEITRRVLADSIEEEEAAKEEESKEYESERHLHAGDSQKSELFDVADGSTYKWTGVKAVFVALFSTTQFEVCIRDYRKRPAPLVGKALVSVSQLQQGEQVLELPLTRPSKGSEPSGTVKLKVTYNWLRGTKDSGSYYGPSWVFVDSRRMRQSSAIKERISTVNHWLLSHDNIWALPPERSSSEGRSSSDGWSPRSRPDLERESSTMLRQDSVTRSEDAECQMMSQQIQDAFKSNGENDKEDLDSFKQNMFAMVSMLAERIEQLEHENSQQRKQMLAVQKAIMSGKPAAQLLFAEHRKPFISGLFEYGMGSAAKGRKVLLFSHKAPGIMEETKGQPAVLIGSFKTDNKGRLDDIALPQSILSTPGHYNINAMLPEDNSFAKGSLYILKPGTKCVVFDLDGTITAGDQEVVQQFVLQGISMGAAPLQNIPGNFDQKQRKHALTCVRLWAAKGYQPVYLSGRQGSFYNLTLEWLMKHNYPPGPIHLTRTHMPTLPVYYSVGNFKVKYMEMLKKRGLDIYAAYGNTGTDIKAYEAVGIPKERTFIVGMFGGQKGTVRVTSYTDHINHVLEYADADPGIPYSELLWSDIPTYKRQQRRRSSVYTPNVPSGVMEDLEAEQQAMGNGVEVEDRA